MTVTDMEKFELSFNIKNGWKWILIEIYFKCGVKKQ